MDIPELAVDNQPVMYPLEVMGARTLWIHGKQIEQLLIRWKGLSIGFQIKLGSMGSSGLAR